MDAPVREAPGSVDRWNGRVGPGWPALTLIILGVYLALNLLTSSDAHLLTDVGGKAASLEAMKVRGDWNPDIGYWFEANDPEGRFFPLDKTLHTDAGTWVNSTSLTLLYAVKPLYDVGGPTLAVLVAMLGGLLCAASAGALERRVDDTSDGKLSFLAIGLSSSVLVYSTDLWEHTLALAASIYAIARTLDSIHEHRPYMSAGVAGLLFGFAATMRQEALVYGFVAGIILVGMTLRKRNVRRLVGASSSMAAGTLIPIAIHTALEFRFLGNAARLQRSVGTAGANNEPNGDRLDAAFTTTTNLLNGTQPAVQIFGLAFTAVCAAAIHRRLGGQPDARAERMVIALGALGVFVHAYFLEPLAALFFSTPLALLGLVSGARRTARHVWPALILALAPLPLVLLTQFTEGHAFVWGGRYLLATGVVLSVVGVSLTRKHHRQLLLFFIAASVVSSLYSAPWVIQRFSNASEDRQAIAEATTVNDVVVWRSAVVAREFGAMSIEQQWLSAGSREDQRALASVLKAQGIDSFVLIVEDVYPGVDFPGFEKREEIGSLTNFGHRIETWSTN